MAVRGQLAADQDVVQVGVRFQVIHRAQHVRQAHTVVVGIGAGRIDVALHENAGIERRTQSRDPQAVAIAHALGLARARAQVDLQHHPMQVGLDARQGHLGGVRLGSEPARELDRVGDRALVLDLVDRRPVHFPVDRDGGPDRGDEDHIPGQQSRIVGGVAADQHVVQIQAAHERAFALQLDLSQRSDRLDAARGEQRRSHRGEAADGVGAGELDVAEHEHPDRAGIGHRDAGAHPVHLPRDPRLEQRARTVEGLAGDADRTELREADAPVAPDYEFEGEIAAAVELHVELVSRANDVVRRYRHVGRRRERRDLMGEQIVAEGLEAGGALLHQRQFRDADVQIAQRGLDSEPQRGQLVGKPGERNRRKTGQHQHAVARQLIGVLGADQVDERLPLPLLFLGELRLRVLRQVAVGLPHAGGKGRIASGGRVLRLVRA